MNPCCEHKNIIHLSVKKIYATQKKIEQENKLNNVVLNAQFH